MIEDIIKFLIEEPEKIKKLFLIFLNIVLNAVFASYLYEGFVGSYYLIHLLDIKAITDFFISGRVLIVVLFYFTSDFILETFKSLVQILLYFGESFLTGLLDHKDFKWFVFKFRIVQKDEVTKEVISGVNFNQFHEILNDLNTDEGKQMMYELKNSLINQVIGVYLKFVFVYYLILFKTTYISVNFIVVTGIIGLTLIYFGASWFVKMLNNVSPGILFELQGIKTKELVDKYLTESGYSVVLEYGKGEKSEPYIERKNVKYYIRSRISHVKFNESIIEGYINRYLRDGNGLILFINQELTSEAKIVSQSFQDKLIVRTYKNEDELRSMIDHLFDEDTILD